MFRMLDSDPSRVYVCTTSLCPWLALEGVKLQTPLATAMRDDGSRVTALGPYLVSSGGDSAVRQEASWVPQHWRQNQVSGLLRDLGAGPVCGCTVDATKAAEPRDRRGPASCPGIGHKRCPSPVAWEEPQRVGDSGLVCALYRGTARHALDCSVSQRTTPPSVQCAVLCRPVAPCAERCDASCTGRRAGRWPTANRILLTCTHTPTNVQLQTMAIERSRMTQP